MFERRGETRALFGIVAQPVKQLREAPLVRVDAAAPVNGFKRFGVGQRGDLLSFLMGAMIAPEHVVVERLHLIVHRNDAGAGSVQGERDDILRNRGSLQQDRSGSSRECLHLVLMGLSGEVRIFTTAVQGIAGRGGS